jgi:FtsH-binding integral membrane protein
MNTVQKLATASWAIPLVYAFAARLVGFVIGQVLADMLVFVVAVAGGLVALFCLVAISRYGRNGILAPAIAGLFVSGLLLAIWVPNYLAARKRARSKASSPVVNGARTVLPSRPLTRA